MIYYPIININFKILNPKQHSIFPGNSNTCSQHNDCPINAHCQYGDDYTKGQCVCNIGYVIGDTENQKECYPVAQTLNDQCQFDAQCMITLSTDSECRYNACQCKEGTHYVPKENKCYASVRKFFFKSVLLFTTFNWFSIL